jgi:hypothetical protein
MEWLWITGDCWLGCGRTGVLVIWLGPVQWDGQHALVRRGPSRRRGQGAGSSPAHACA